MCSRGMELLPEALILCQTAARASLQGALAGSGSGKIPGLRPNSQSKVGWDQAALLDTMDRFWMERFQDHRVGGGPSGRSSTSWSMCATSCRNRRDL